MFGVWVLYKALADLVVLAHFAYLAAMVFGAFAAVRPRRVAHARRRLAFELSCERPPRIPPNARVVGASLQAIPETATAPGRFV